MKKEIKTVVYDDELRLEAYRFEGVVQLFPNHFHEYYVIGFVEGGERCLSCRNQAYTIGKGNVILVNYPLSKANGLPASSTSQPTISTGVNLDSPCPMHYSYAICLNPSASMFFAALISLSCFVPHLGHIHSLTDKSFVSAF